MKFKNQQQGFSLLEVVLALVIFSIIVTVVGGVFAFLIQIQAKSLNSQKIQENAQFILETIARELRVSNCISTDPACQTRLPNNLCSALQSTITIQHPTNGTVVYALNNNTIIRTAGGISGQISASNVKVTNLNFCIQNNLANDAKQPKVTVLLTIETGSGRNYVSTKLQTTLSARALGD